MFRSARSTACQATIPSLRVVSLALAAVLGAGCKQTQPQNQPSTSAAPAAPKAAVTVQPPAPQPPEPMPNPEEPLLLLDQGMEPGAPGQGSADNSRCLVCHLNFATEKLTTVHARARIGCEKCHGASDAHIADESWASGGNGTAPDIMFTKEQINPFCLDCHVRARLEIEAHKPFFAGTSREKYCTDCHGQHRMAQRKCKWK